MFQVSSEEELIEHSPPEFKEFVDNSANQKTKKGLGEVLSDTPIVLRVLGIGNKPIVISSYSIRHILKDHPEMNTEYIKGFAEEISNPVMVFNSDTRKNSIVVVTEILTEIGPVIVPIKLDSNLNRVS